MAGKAGVKRWLGLAGVRRLPVIDGHDLVGMISLADIATNVPQELVGELVESIAAAPNAD